MDTVLYSCLGVGIAAIIALAVYIIVSIRKSLYIKSLYSSSVRDSRFAYSLLKLFFGKYVIRSPYLVKNPQGISPQCDVIAVLKGGIVIITVLDKKGFYRTPANDSWTLTTENGSEKIPNAHKNAAHYLDAINEVLIKTGISSQVMANVVLLSDDNAKFDELYPEGILTGNMLVSYCKDINKTHILSNKERLQIIDAITKHSKICRAYIEKNMFTVNSKGSATNTPSPADTTEEFDI